MFKKKDNKMLSIIIIIALAILVFLFVVVNRSQDPLTPFQTLSIVTSFFLLTNTVTSILILLTDEDANEKIINKLLKRIPMSAPKRQFKGRFVDLPTEDFALFGHKPTTTKHDTVSPLKPIHPHLLPKELKTRRDRPHAFYRGSSADIYEGQLTGVPSDPTYGLPKMPRRSTETKEHIHSQLREQLMGGLRSYDLDSMERRVDGYDDMTSYKPVVHESNREYMMRQGIDAKKMYSAVPADKRTRATLYDRFVAGGSDYMKPTPWWDRS